jgi:hypothetical protein
LLRAERVADEVINGTQYRGVILPAFGRAPAIISGWSVRSIGGWSTLAQGARHD